MRRAGGSEGRARVKLEGGGGGGGAQDKDLAYYIHDRVDLMHQVFSVLKAREMRAMMPDCARNLTMDDLQELCLEELLGISSKRLCAILDGADAPTDTSSSDSDNGRPETISLDSISDDDLVVDQDKKEKRKCKRKQKKATDAAKHIDKPAAAGAVGNDGEVNSRAAERAGMTVLELLELQARARAIRAQLALEQTKKAAEAVAKPSESELVPDEELFSDDSVEIKEEPAEVVELISSDEEDIKLEKPETPEKALPSLTCQSTVTKKNDLTIIVPNKQPHRKIKLNRNKVMASVTSVPESLEADMPSVINEPPKESTNRCVEITNAEQIKDKNSLVKVTTENNVSKKPKKKEKKRKIVKKINRKISHDGSDHDEINLELSDTEKMDLLEDFDRSKYDNVSSSDDESGSDSSEESDHNITEEIFNEDMNILQEKEKDVTDEEPVKITQIENLNEKNEIGQRIDISEKEETKLVSSENEQIKYSTNGIKIKEFENKVEMDIEVMGVVDNNDEQTHTEYETQMDVDSTIIEINDNENVENTTKSVTEQTAASFILENTQVKNNKVKDGSMNPELQPEIAVVVKRCLPNIEENTGSKIVISSIDDLPLMQDYFGPKNIEIEIGSLENVEAKETSDYNGDVQKLTEDSDKNIEQSNLAESQENYITDKEITVEIVETTDNQRANEIELPHITQSTEELQETKDPQETEAAVAASKEKEKVPKTDMSEGELTDRTSSEVEMFEKSAEIVCISDDDDDVPQLKKKKSKKKKEKKSKKEKKAKKDNKSDFREAADQNFYAQSDSTDEEMERVHKHYGRLILVKNSTAEQISSTKFETLSQIVIDSKVIEDKYLLQEDKNPETEIVDLDNPKKEEVENEKEIVNVIMDLQLPKNVAESPLTESNVSDKINSDNVSRTNPDNLYEILEISDDSSCCEVEGVSVLSKEPTSEEIEALSAKIDTEIEREDIVTEAQIKVHENNDDNKERETPTDTENLEDVSWKDRWLESGKVKKVLFTSNILNTMRKKNKELKKKIAESKTKCQTEHIPGVIKEKTIEEGSIEHFNMLTGSTQFVHPVEQPIDPSKLIKDAAQLTNGQAESHNENESSQTAENSIDENEFGGEFNSITIPERLETMINATDSIVENKETSEVDKDLKKDAKQLLKMYKRLLKYNKMEKQADPNKTKKKKSKKNKKSKERTTDVLT